MSQKIIRQITISYYLTLAIEGSIILGFSNYFKIQDQIVAVQKSNNPQYQTCCKTNFYLN